MAKIPKDPKEIFPEIIADYKNLFGDDLVSIILYGSATGQEYRPGKSDINFMIVLSEEGIENLDLAFSSVKKWLKRNVAVPLFLTESYVETSLDAFPIEYLNIQRNYIRVFGKDILKDLEFNPDFLRLQCEREIKGKLILLREKFLQTGGRGKALIEVIENSLPAFIAIFKALVYLIKGKDLPQEKTRIIRSIAEELDIDAGVFEKLLDIKEEKVKLDESEITNLFKDYLRQVRKLSKLVDALGG
jgi:predicted nucleotidyltransferase